MVVGWDNRSINSVEEGLVHDTTGYSMHSIHCDQ